MVNWLIGLIVTTIFLIKMIFEDMNGGKTVTETIKDAAKEAKQIREALKAEETK